MITQSMLDQTYSKYAHLYGGNKNDYFAPLYLQEQFKQPFEQAAAQSAFGGNDFGLDAFHIDKQARNLYLYQFKWAKNHMLFADSLKRLRTAGMDRVFGDPYQNTSENPFLIQLRASIHELRAVVERVYVYFIFNGDPQGAQSSSTLRNLKEDLESRKDVVLQFFKRDDVEFQAHFRNQAGLVDTPPHPVETFRFEVDYTSATSVSSDGASMHLGFMPISDLVRMYERMQIRLFERNIRAGLSEKKSPNRAIRASLNRMVSDGKEDPSCFVFLHNGVTLAAERLDFDSAKCTITDPHVLNGAQTITTAHRFWLDEVAGKPAASELVTRFHGVRVIAKLILSQDREFVTTVTIGNNKQNRVEPWNLRANDLIQWRFEDKFRTELLPLAPGLYYERQENTFRCYKDSELKQMNLAPGRAIEIKKLAQTFLAARGEVGRMSELRDVFDSDTAYNETFSESFLDADVRRILLLYKLHFGVKRMIDGIRDSGAEKHSDYYRRAKNLIWALASQALLNSPELERLADDYGADLVCQTSFVEFLNNKVAPKVRMVLLALGKEANIARAIDDGKYDFLRSQATYSKAMAIAKDKYGWSKRQL